MNSDLNGRQINLKTTDQRMIYENLVANRLIPDLSEVGAQPPKNPNQKSADFNQFYNSQIYRS